MKKSHHLNPLSPLKLVIIDTKHMLTSSYRLINLIGIFLVIFSVSGCKKSSEPSHYTISDEIKQWYLYQKGSYWIYYNDKTLEIDCTYISKTPYSWQENVLKDDGSVGATSEHILINFNDGIILDSHLMPQEVDIDVPHSNSSITFNENILEGHKWSIDHYTIFEFIHHYDSMAVENHFFQDVRQTRYAFARNDSGPDSVIITFFFAKHTGLIKLTKSISGIDTTWSVIRYHPIQ